MAYGVLRAAPQLRSPFAAAVLVVLTVASGFGLIDRMAGAARRSAQLVEAGVPYTPPDGNFLGMLPPPRLVIIESALNQGLMPSSYVRHCLTLVGRNDDTYFLVDPTVGNYKSIRVPVDGSSLIGPIGNLENSTRHECDDLELRLNRIGSQYLADGNLQISFVRCGRSQWNQIDVRFGSSDGSISFALLPLTEETSTIKVVPSDPAQTSGATVHTVGPTGIEAAGLADGLVTFTFIDSTRPESELAYEAAQLHGPSTGLVATSARTFPTMEAFVLDALSTC